MIEMLGFGSVMGAATSQVGAASQAQAQSQLMAAAQTSAFDAGQYSNAAHNRVVTSEGAEQFYQERLQRLGMSSVPFDRSDTIVSSVAATAASRVSKPDWEIEEDRKDAELEAWLDTLNLPSRRAA